MAAVQSSNRIDVPTNHEDLVHDAQLDYYGKRLATCSSDRTVRIFDTAENGAAYRLVDTLRGHDGPVWQVAWAHPKYGSLLASCGYEGKVVVWKEVNGSWAKVKEFDKSHSASVNSISWAPHDYGLILAAGSSDGRISVHTCKEDGSWESSIFNGHGIGVNAVSWAPSSVPGSLLAMASPAQGANAPKRFASGGCDNVVKIWREENGTWREDGILEGHSDWVRDVAWAPTIGLPTSYIASCSQDKTVLIWTQEAPGTPWTKKALKADPFTDVVWRVSWSLMGNVLAVSCGDNKITLWKEALSGEWEQCGTADG
ncbi:WD40-repeat-containing domain protein [Hyaloraphidium curvatum]|nr:WD40-repeat-containing domain protein [Hyaloraphidium curvatum]